MAFDFLPQLLSVQRTYDYSALDREFVRRESSRMTLDYPNAKFVLPVEGPLGKWGCPTTVVAHLAAPPSAGVKEIETAFDVKLPCDFKEFYHLHNEAFILCRNPVLIMSPQQIIDVSDDLRDAHSIPDDQPRHVIRFGWLGTDSYFLLRFNAGINDWEVMLSSYSHATDAELQNRTAWGSPCDRTFTDWLCRFLKTDGAPLHPSHQGDFDFSNERIT